MRTLFVGMVVAFFSMLVAVSPTRDALTTAANNNAGTQANDEADNPPAPQPETSTLPSRSVQETGASTAVVLALDTTGSMEGAAFEEAKEAARLFVRRMGSEVEASVVAFSDRAEVVQPLTSDREALVAAINGLELGDKAALYDGAYAAVSAAAGSSASERLVVLLSDSRERENQSQAERNAALELAEAEGVAVFTVSLGDQADVAYLEALSAGTNGLYYEAATPDELLTIYEALVMQFAATEGNLPTSASDEVEVIAPESTDITSEIETTTAVVLALDTTGSMEGAAFEEAKEAARLFVRRMGSEVEASVVVFSDRAEVVQPLTSNREALVAAINGLELGDKAALYDGAYVAVREAAGSLAAERMVVLLTDSRERENQSEVERDAALELAEAEGVAVFTISLGDRADVTYLETLSAATNGLYYEAATPDELADIYDALAIQFATPGEELLLDTSTPTPLLIPPINDPIASLNLGGGENAEPQIDLPEGLIPVLGDDPSLTLTSHVTPITINLPADIDVESAALMLNGYTLATFSEGPYEHDLDTRRLTAGQYTLTFAITNSSGVESAGSLDFEVVLLERLPAAVDSNEFGLDDLISIPGLADDDVDELGVSPKPLAAGPVPRLLLINGEVQPFNLRFTLEEGLVLVAPEPSSEAAPSETLMDILNAPCSPDTGASGGCLDRPAA